MEPRYPVSCGRTVILSSKSSPCSPASRIAAPRAPGARPSPLVTATSTSGPGSEIPGTRLARSADAGASSTRGWGASLPQSRLMPNCHESGGAEIFRRYRVQELPELLYLVLLLVRDGDADLVEDLLAGEYRRAGPEREGDRVRGPGADLLAVGEDQVSEEDPVPERGDIDGLELHVEGIKDISQQIVSQRPGRNHAFLRKSDGRRLVGPDPDRQVPFPLRLLQQDDGVIRRHLNPDAHDLHLPHGGSVLTCA